MRPGVSTDVRRPRPPPIKPGSDRPKYQRIADDLRARIRSGEYPGGSALPSQRRLSEDYRVTLMTLRQALAVLVAEGVIEQQAGRGTFVLRAGPSHSLQSLLSLVDELARQRVELVTDVLARSVRRLPGHVATALQVDQGWCGLRLERLRAVDGRALLHQVSWVPEPWGGQIRDRDFAVVPLYAALAEASGLRPSWAEENLGAIGATARLAALTGRPIGSPMLSMSRITMDDSGRPLVADAATVLDTRLRLVTERHADTLRYAWRWPDPAADADDGA